MGTSKRLDVQIWSDIACPWCYVGKRRFEAALLQFPEREGVVVRWRSFELDPSAPPEASAEFTYAQRLARKYGNSERQAQGMIDNMTALAAREGVQMDFERIRPGNTLHAHRLLHFAYEQGLQDQLKEQLLRAYLCEGKLVADPDVLLQAALAVGLDQHQANAVIASDAYEVDVRQDESLARASGITGVPFFAVGRYGVSGAQPVEVLLKVLQKAWDEVSPEVPQTSTAAADAPACGPDGCS